MDPISVVLLGVGLAMDAFTVSICKGLAMRSPGLREMAAVGLWFGGFQMMMPIIGYYLGESFYRYISDFDYLVAFGLLAVIGLNMIREALSKDGDDTDGGIGLRTMLLLAVATSIDALAAGISLAMSGSDIWADSAVIGIITFLMSAAGVKMGSIVGDRFSSKAKFIGGAILILIGAKILLEHSGYL